MTDSVPQVISEYIKAREAYVNSGPEEMRNGEFTLTPQGLTFIKKMDSLSIRLATLLGYSRKSVAELEAIADLAGVYLNGQRIRLGRGSENA